MDMAQAHTNSEENEARLLDMYGGVSDEWLLDLYGLADNERKKHTILNCAVYHLKQQLNVQPELALTVSGDVIKEIETVDPYLTTSDEEYNNLPNPYNHNQDQDQDQVLFVVNDLKKLDNRSVIITDGFIRDEQNMIHSSNGRDPYFDIPQLSYYLILYYYYFMKPKEWKYCKCGASAKSMDDEIWINIDADPITAITMIPTQDINTYDEIPTMQISEAEREVTTPRSWFQQVEPFFREETTTNDNNDDDDDNDDNDEYGLIPENWLLDLYGLADETRKKHSIMNCAIQGLKHQLALPISLAEKVSHDIIHEIETVDPYLIQEIQDCDLNKSVSNEFDNVSTSIPFSLEELKKINVGLVNLNKGYIAKCQRELSLDKDCDNPYFDIPELVQYLIFYYCFYMKPRQWVYCTCGRYTRNINDKLWIPTDFMQHCMISDVAEYCGCTMNRAKEILQDSDWIKENAIERIEAIESNNDDMMVIN